jgi:hypothetical protein
VSARTIALFAALTAFLGGRDYHEEPERREPRRVDERERERHRQARAMRGSRRYERWRRSRGNL